jgi:hypothetical protein
MAKSIWSFQFDKGGVAYASGQTTTYYSKYSPNSMFTAIVITIFVTDVCSDQYL